MNFVYKNWAKAGIGIAVIILIFIFFIQKNKLPLLEKFILLNIAFLMLHQAEEYVYHGGFKDYFNQKLYNPFGFLKNKLTDAGIIWVNVVLGWGMNIFVYIFLKNNPIAVMIMIVILFYNGILHFFLAFKTQEYNPGLITGAILFLPFGFYSYYKVNLNQMISTTDLAAILVFSIFVTLVIPVIIFLTREKRHK
ncbi:MAG: HXXEE domain-containing protein [Ignavibacteria bacterium]|nr:HXXEE domain-containing protein [Ignavibacteria bacterium]